jgi:hypothetical protein
LKEELNLSSLLVSEGNSSLEGITDSGDKATGKKKEIEQGEPAIKKRPE